MSQISDVLTVTRIVASLVTILIVVIFDVADLKIPTVRRILSVLATIRTLVITHHTTQGGGQRKI